MSLVQPLHPSPPLVWHRETEGWQGWVEGLNRYPGRKGGRWRGVTSGPQTEREEEQDEEEEG